MAKWKEKKKKVEKNLNQIASIYCLDLKTIYAPVFGG